jgi:type IV pilus assembly protein PilP
MRTLLSTVIAGAAALALVACGNDPAKAINAAQKGPSAAAPAASAAPAPVAAASAPPPMPRMEFAENDFVESDRNRDPFRSYASMFAPEQNKRVAQTDRQIILPQYSLDELKLVAIVTGGEYPRAMVTDPGGKGWVLKRGDWVGRPDVVHVGGANGADYQINWRVEKVRDGDIVFTREDPAQPGIPPATRVIAIRPEGDSANPRERL